MKNRKSQMEIMGLAIILILLILGMIFVVRFIIMKEPSDAKKRFTETQLSSNMLNTLLNTNTEDCFGMTLTELLQDCAQGETRSCGGSGSCGFAEQTIRTIFGDTFDEWNIEYYFYFYLPSSTDDPIVSLGERCSGDKKTEQYPIPTSAGIWVARLEICS